MLLTLDDYKSYVQISGDSLDDALQVLADATEDIVQGYLRKSLKKTTFTELVNGSGRDTIILENYPILSVDKIERFVDGSYTELTEDDYDRLLVTNKDTEVYLDGYKFVEGSYNYRITYVSGYSYGSLPNEIKLALRKIFNILYNESPLKFGTVGLKSFKISGRGSGEDYIIDKDAVDKVLGSIAHLRKRNV